MATKVDVLAVLEALEGWAREVSDEFIDGGEFRAEYTRDLRDARDARAAIAELIASATGVLDAESNSYNACEVPCAALNRLASALAALSTNEGGR